MFFGIALIILMIIFYKVQVGKYVLVVFLVSIQTDIINSTIILIITICRMNAIAHRINTYLGLKLLKTISFYEYVPKQELIATLISLSVANILRIVLSN